MFDGFITGPACLLTALLGSSEYKLGFQTSSEGGHLRQQAKLFCRFLVASKDRPSGKQSWALWENAAPEKAGPSRGTYCAGVISVASLEAPLTVRETIVSLKVASGWV